MLITLNFIFLPRFFQWVQIPIPNSLLEIFIWISNTYLEHNMFQTDYSIILCIPPKLRFFFQIIAILVNDTITYPVFQVKHLGFILYLTHFVMYHQYYFKNISQTSWFFSNPILSPQVSSSSRFSNLGPPWHHGLDHSFFCKETILGVVACLAACLASTH